jgi:Cupin-like domain
MLCPPHPLGVRPRGNAYTGLSAPDVTRSSLGPFYGALPEALLAGSILPCCDAASLDALAQTSRALYAFARDDELWRTLVLREYPRDFRFACSWRRTHARARGLNKRARKDGEWPVHVVQATGIYSDVLFHKWRCQSAELDPSWLEVENVARVNAADLSAAEFCEQFEIPGVPVVVTGLVDKWEASKPGIWTREDFAERFGEMDFVAGGFEFNMRRYLEYGDATVGKCDQPLYLFDKNFATKAPALAAEYDVPDYFSDDLFQHMGPGDSARPAYRWLIIGPRNSGSSFHKDPNGTSAWNACVRGSKRWVLFPPSTPPPGVHPSTDECEVTAPVSVLEWYLSYYEAARATDMGLECTVKAGEIMFVPAGWWHAVVNLEWSSAVTQNYVSAIGFERVAQWLKERPGQVSGCRDAEHGKEVALTFAPRVVKARPELALGLRKSEATKRTMEKKCPSRGLWEGLRVASGTVGESGGGSGTRFSFGLG